MPVYISKNAITHNPLINSSVNIQDNLYPPLQSVLLNEDKYLRLLNRNDLSAFPLSMVNHGAATYSSVNRIKLALQVLDENPYDGFTIPTNLILVPDGVYDQDMEQIVTLFQQFVGLAETGIVDALTLHSIDQLLSPRPYIVDNKTNIFVGEKVDKSISILGEYNVETLKYTYTFNIDENIFSIELDTHINVTPVVKDNTNRSEMYFVIEDNEVLDKVQEGNNISDDSNSEYVSIPYDNFKLKDKPDLPLNDAVLNIELGKKPSKILNDENSKLHLVKETDNFLDIILENYYNTATEIINPYDGSIITTLPARLISAPEDRGDDARLQFYFNILYYYNTVEKVDENNELIEFIEYGMKADATNYIRYNNNDLNDYYMFNNIFDINEEQTVKPNYYRFLEAHQANKINFLADGNTNSFLPNPGNYIRIPSRQFVDSLYYHLNFRHKEMLSVDLGYVMGSVLGNTINQMMTTTVWGAFNTWLSDEVEELYNETLAFFKDIYSYAMSIVNVIPRGLGANIEVGVGVTWGYPIATDVKLRRQLWRKMTPKDELTFIFREYGEFAVGLDAAVGLSAGFKVGSGKSKRTAGVALAAGVEAKLRPNITLDYEFPIRQEETALLTMVLNMIDSTGVISDVLGTLNVINLDPRNYLVRKHLGFPLEGRGWANAQIGLGAGDDKHIEYNRKANANTPEAARKSFLNIDNIWDNIGIRGEGNLSLGYEFEYKAKFENNPLIPEIEGRIPSEVETENLYFASADLHLGAMGNILQRFFLNLGLAPFFATLNFEKGIALALSHKYTRLGEARDITKADIDIGVLDNPAGVTAYNGGIRFNNDTWESYIALGSFTGNVDELCMPGTESFIKLNAHKIYEILNGGVNFEFKLGTLADILSIFYSFSYRYKTGFGFNGHRRKKIATSVFDSSKKMSDGVKKDFLRVANQNLTALDIYAGVDLGVEFILNKPAINKALTYFFKRLYLIYKYKVLDDNTAFYKKLIGALAFEEEGIIKNLTGVEKSRIAYYEELYTSLEEYLDSEYEAELTTEIDLTPPFKIYARMFMQFVEYLYDTVTPAKGNIKSDYTVFIADGKKEDIGVIKILEVVSALAEISNLSVALEAQLGASLRAQVKAGAGATVRLAFSGRAGLIDHTQILENGVMPNLDSDDPYFHWFNLLTPLFNPDSTSETGIRNSIISINK